MQFFKEKEYSKHYFTLPVMVYNTTKENLSVLRKPYKTGTNSLNINYTDT